jgi:hypothetical protein
MERIARYGKAVAREGGGAQLAKLLLEAAEELRGDPGCELYLVNRQSGEEDVIWVTDCGGARPISTRHSSGSGAATRSPPRWPSSRTGRWSSSTCSAARAPGGEADLPDGCVARRLHRRPRQRHRLVGARRGAAMSSSTRQLHRLIGRGPEPAQLAPPASPQHRIPPGDRRRPTLWLSHPWTHPASAQAGLYLVPGAATRAVSVSLCANRRSEGGVTRGACFSSKRALRVLRARRPHPGRNDSPRCA